MVGSRSRSGYSVLVEFEQIVVAVASRRSDCAAACLFLGLIDSVLIRALLRDRASRITPGRPAKL